MTRTVLHLVSAQLTADLRRPRSGGKGLSRLTATILAYGFSGVLLALSLYEAPPAQTLWVSCSFGLMLALFGVVGSFEELMGRPKENAWLITLPASETEHYAARLAGIGVTIGLMATSVTLPVAVSVSLSTSWEVGVLVGFLLMASVVWTSLAALAALWGVTLATPPALRQRGLSTLRVLLILGLVVGYQWIGARPEAADIIWWPPTWFTDILTPGHDGWGVGLLLSTSALLLWLIAHTFSGRYFDLLHRSAQGRDAENRPAPHRLTEIERRLVGRGATRAAYGFAVASLRDDRLVRARLAPAALLPLGFALFGSFAGGLGSLIGVSPVDLFTMPGAELHLSLLVILLFAALTLVQAVQVSDDADAAWVFSVLPEAPPRRLQMGVQQALTMRVAVPLLLAIGALLTTQMSVVDAAIHALFLFGVTLTTMRLYALLHRRTPFSQHADRFSGGRRFLSLLLAIPIGAVALVMQALTFVTPLSALLTGLGLVIVSIGLAGVVSRVGGPPDTPRAAALRGDSPLPTSERPPSPNGSNGVSHSRPAPAEVRA